MNICAEGGGKIGDGREMCVDRHTLTVLGYARLKEILGESAVSEPGRQVIEKLSPLALLPDVVGRLDRAGEMRTLIESDGGPPLESLPDVLPLLSLAEKQGSVLAGHEILKIGKVLRTGRLVRNYLADRNASAPHLASDVEPLVSFIDLEKRISRSFDGGGNLLDEASSRLAEIRREGAAARRQIVSRLESLVHDATYRTGVQEELVTQRSGRYVIPLKSGADPHMKGIVHDRSASGATFFVEPLEVVHDNNRLAILSADEKAEVERILGRFTHEIGGIADNIETLFCMVAEVDALAAIGRFAAATGGSVPRLAESGSLELLAARHPLLLHARKGESGSVVPLDLRLDEEVSVLLITGPNAGGKTVALKTVGLVVLMLRTGIPVPVSPDSRVPLFSSIYADIGDEQSIEAALSTYSAHIKRMGQFLAEARRGTLVLIDEMGAGTDPEEGGALAAAILERLQESGALSIVTTHLGFLKETAAKTPGMLNASMAFDAGTKKPAYRLVIGETGLSNPLQVAEEMRLPQDLIERAKGLKDGRVARLDQLIGELTAGKAELEDKNRRAEEAKNAAEEALRTADELKAAAREEARRSRESAGKETRTLLDRARKLLKEAEKAAEKVAEAERESETLTAVSTLKHEASEIEELCPQAQPVPRGTTNYRPSPEDWVKVIPFGQVGRVAYVTGDTAEVLIGTLKARVPVADLEPSAAQDMHKSRISPVVSRLTEEASSRLDLLGRRVDEALSLLDKFLDQSSLDGLHSVTVVHGIGTGALKDAVASFLKGHVHVADFRPGEQPEGGAGVTVVSLR
ncbi:MAG: endonuclease MutS2 [Nitrospirota bacterium]|nr:endonuclease MutS2 [Nitrospirota bacterium]